MLTRTAQAKSDNRGPAYATFKFEDTFQASALAAWSSFIQDKGSLDRLMPRCHQSGCISLCFTLPVSSNRGPGSSGTLHLDTITRPRIGPPPKLVVLYNELGTFGHNETLRGGIEMKNQKTGCNLMAWSDERVKKSMGEPLIR